ncbi:hypothetical protein ACS0TY_022013 [Phlomoides rotata]
MECWIPLFKILLSSPCPESEASKWLQENFNPSSNATSISTTSLLSLLTRPSVESSSPQEKRNRIMWIQTLPNLVQARILSFLAYDHQRFCKRELCKLARIVLSEGKGVDFWVKRAAQQLLDIVSVSNYQWLSHLNLDSEEDNVDEEFYLMPDWLRDVAKESEPMFPWLPMSPDQLSDRIHLSGSEGIEDDLPIDVEQSKQVQSDEEMLEIDVRFDDPIDAEVEKAAKSLKSRLVDIESTSKAVDLAKEIRKLCFESRTNYSVILNLIEPWGVDDEIAAVLISHLLDGSEADKSDWASHILCSIVLPKFLVLNEPASRVLVNALIDYCKAHQGSVECALLFPLILRNDGINNPICDVITRIVKECLHPAHVSAICQKLLSKDKHAQGVICLPSHRPLIGGELVWTESMFSLWQNILNHNVHLMQDSVDQLVKLVCRNSDRVNRETHYRTEHVRDYLHSHDPK